MEGGVSAYPWSRTRPRRCRRAGRQRGPPVTARWREGGEEREGGMPGRVVERVDDEDGRGGARLQDELRGRRRRRRRRLRRGGIAGA